MLICIDLKASTFWLTAATLLAYINAVVIYVFASEKVKEFLGITDVEKRLRQG